MRFELEWISLVASGDTDALLPFKLIHASPASQQHRRSMAAAPQQHRSSIAAAWTPQLCIYRPHQRRSHLWRYATRRSSPEVMAKGFITIAAHSSTPQQHNMSHCQLDDWLPMPKGIQTRGHFQIQQRTNKIKCARLPNLNACTHINRWCNVDF